MHPVVLHQITVKVFYVLIEMMPTYEFSFTKILINILQLGEFLIFRYHVAKFGYSQLFYHPVNELPKLYFNPSFDEIMKPLLEWIDFLFVTYDGPNM